MAVLVGVLAVTTVAAQNPPADLYDGRLGDVRVPVLLIHGDADPRTEPSVALPRLKFLCRYGPRI